MSKDRSISPRTQGGITLKGRCSSCRVSGLLEEITINQYTYNKTRTVTYHFCVTCADQIRLHEKTQSRFGGSYEIIEDKSSQKTVLSDPEEVRE